MRSNEELCNKVCHPEHDHYGVGSEGELAQRSLPLLAGKVDHDGQSEDYGQPTGRSTEPDRSIGKFRNEKSCFCHFQL